MQNKLTKYHAATEAAERWLDEIEKEMRPVATRYSEIMSKTDDRFRYDHRFPGGIEHITHHQGNVIFSGHSYFRGCSHSESISIPREIVYGTDEEREHIFTKMESDIAAKQKAAADQEAREIEATEKAHFLALRAKYEGTPHVR